MADSRQGPDGLSRRADVPVSRLPDRGRVVCHGQIEAVTYLPADQGAAFIAIVADPHPPEGTKPAAGSGRRVRVVWLGRRKVPGIQTGTEVRIEGMLAQSQGLPTIFNPRYEILSRQEHE